MEKIYFLIRFFFQHLFINCTVCISLQLQQDTVSDIQIYAINVGIDKDALSRFFRTKDEIQSIVPGNLLVCIIKRMPCRLQVYADMSVLNINTGNITPKIDTICRNV